MTSDLPDGPSVEYDSETDAYRATFDCADISPGMAVVDVMASITGMAPLDLPPLYDVVDPEALDQLCSGYTQDRHEADGKMEFSYPDYAVTVKSYGIIEVEPRPPGE